MHEGLKRFKINDQFFGHYQKLVQEVVIPYQEKALKNEIAGVDKSYAVENFRLAAQMVSTGRCDGEFGGLLFQDSDLAKWLEAAAYSLAITKDEALETRCDEIIDLIAGAQHTDGYLNTFFTVKMPGQRWTNLYEAHELYCAGHMMEAAVAYHEATGKDKLLKVMCRMADHIAIRFLDEATPGYPGHPEIELALFRLYLATGNERYLALSKHFVDVRGVDSDYFISEIENRSWRQWGGNGKDKEYEQNHMPVRDMDEAVGHAVRAVYLYSAMADLANATKETALSDACKRLFQNITERRMYITGAIGSAYEGEVFTKDYHLPNDSAYAETCAAIGLIFFARRMLEMEADSTYADTMERALYNCVPAGMQLDGKRFFYVNPLEVVPGISGEVPPLRHVLPERTGWFGCACCPPNVARLMLSLGAYAFGESENTVFSHLFIGGEYETKAGKLLIQTGYPYEGTIRYGFAPEKESMAITLAIRIPAWSEKTEIFLNGAAIQPEIKRGYAYIKHTFQKTDVVVLKLDMEPRRVFAKNDVAADNGRVAFMRGPLVYCAEGVDNQGQVLNLLAPADGDLKELLCEEERLRGCVIIKVRGYCVENPKTLYTTQRPERRPCQITLIPYYAWGNRGKTPMRVWLPEI